ncbi:hypothetical protein [Paenibacillus daejeonensis]|uniref:hypothetical protein n=1 Tax=Paenibacillus daejeonensis TaxID=135193 RepID=UPI000363C5A2|nr:hypothetical protein [Paenibacillus daejeonensis]
MAYTDFRANLKKINLKPKGVKEIVLEVSDDELYGKIDKLAALLDSRVSIAVDSESVRYSVPVHAKTKEPIHKYDVDHQGVVTKVVPEGEQAELDLGIPHPSEPITEIPEEISKETVDAFIMELLAPSYNDLDYPFVAWILQLNDGHTYLKIAQDNEMPSGKLIELIDEYRSRVAPLAAKWAEWKKTQPVAPAQQQTDPEGSNAEEPGESLQEGDDAGQHQEPTDSGDDIELEDGEDTDQGEDQTPPSDVEHDDDELSDWEQEVLQGNEPQSDSQPPEPPQEDKQPVELSKDEIEAIILRDRPKYDEIPYDFPAFLERRKAGETWMNIAQNLGVSSSKVSSEWKKYKELVSKQYGA